MQPTVPASGAFAAFEEKIRHLPAPAQEAYRRYRADGNVAELDTVVIAILEDFIPKTPERPLAELPGGTKLMLDLNFDSLAITEVVFFTEDLLGIRISNEEISQVETLDDLRAFVRRKASSVTAR